MKIAELKKILARNPQNIVCFVLPTGSKIPAHAHITEVARIDKRFVDCGGTLRNESTCRLQSWFSDDTEHRLTANTLLKILAKAEGFLGGEDLEVDLEHETPFISQFPVLTAKNNGSALEFSLGTKHTACLAEDACLAPAPKGKSLLLQALPTLELSKCCG